MTVRERITDGNGTSLAALSLLTLLTIGVPLGIRVVDARYGGPDAPPTYLPALEGPRVRMPFAREPIAELAASQPALVVIGDSMAGSRVDRRRLRELSHGSVAMLVQLGSGPAYWYLALKNWVIPSGIRPRAVLIFFRDTNLTNVLFRLDEGYRSSVDRVAHDREDELNDVIGSRTVDLGYRARTAVERVFGADQARLWLEPALTEGVGRALIPGRRRRTDFIAAMNARFGSEHLRPIKAADVEAAVDLETDFDADVHRSVLPYMLRDAKAAGLTLCFVRVQRRPIDGKMPAQSPALRRYVAALSRYVQAQGGRFLDDTGDPALTLDMYKDGDHLGGWAARRYTEHLYGRLRRVVRDLP